MIVWQAGRLVFDSWTARGYEFCPIKNCDAVCCPLKGGRLCNCGSFYPTRPVGMSCLLSTKGGKIVQLWFFLAHSACRYEFCLIKNCDAVCCPLKGGRLCNCSSFYPTLASSGMGDCLIL